MLEAMSAWQRWCRPSRSFEPLGSSTTMRPTRQLMQVLHARPRKCSLHCSKQCTAVINDVNWMVRQCIPRDGVWFAPAQLMLQSADMHRAGLAQLSRLRKLQHLSLSGCFASCTHRGLGAALAAMTGIAPFTSARDRCHSCLCSPCFWLVHCEPLCLQSAHRPAPPNICSSSPICCRFGSAESHGLRLYDRSSYGCHSPTHKSHSLVR